MGAKKKAKTDELVSVSLKLPAGLRERIERQASRLDRSASWVMVDTLSRQLERDEQRQRFIDEARQAWESYCDTGEHHTLADARALQKRLKAGRA